MTTLWLRWLHDAVWLYGQTQTFEASLNIKTNSMLWVFLEALIASKMFINSPFYSNRKFIAVYTKGTAAHDFKPF